MNALLEKHLTATLTADEAAALAQALAENPALADAFAAATRMENELRAALKEQTHTALYTRRMERAAEEAEPEVRRRSWIRPMAAAATVALVGGGGLAFLHSQQAGLADDRPTPRKPTATMAAQPREESESFPTDTSRADATALKRKLLRFTASSKPARGLPVSQALLQLETEWKAYDHREARDKEITFTIADAALKSWPKQEDEPQVALEIPGISLLTSAELIAAQAGLRATVTPAGLTLEPETRKDDGQPRTWNLPLAAGTLSSFFERVEKETERVRPKFTSVPLLDNVGHSWMERTVSSEFGTLDHWEPGFVLPDSSASQQNETAGAPESGVASKFIEVTDHLSGQTVDLHLAPQVVEFDDFINYGEPIQTTGINALGQEEPIILTESRIINPVFRRRLFHDHPASLTRLLAAHGANSAGVSWDAEKGTVTARGSLRELRTASATLAAVRESAAAGLVFEARFFEWPDGGVQGVAANPGGSQVVSATEAAELVKKLQAPGAGTLVSYPRVVSAAGQSVEIKSATNTPMPDGSPMPTGTTIYIGETWFQGMAVHAKLSLVTTSVVGAEINDGKSWPVPSSSVLTSDLHLRCDTGETFRADIAGNAATKPVTLLLTVRPAAVP